jgi:hypothetical protein
VLQRVGAIEDASWLEAGARAGAGSAAAAQQREAVIGAVYEQVVFVADIHFFSCWGKAAAAAHKEEPQ